MNNNESLALAIERLLKSDADARAFLRTTKSHQLACQGAREAVAALSECASNEPAIVVRQP